MGKRGELPADESNSEPTPAKVKAKKRRKQADDREPGDDLELQIRVPGRSDAKKDKKKRKKAELDTDDLEPPDDPEEIGAPDPREAKKDKKKKKAEKIDAYSSWAEIAEDKASKDPRSPWDLLAVAKEKKEELPAVNNSLRVFVSGIPKTVEEATLRRDFEECGEIANFKLLLDGQTWQSRGLAFITFKDEAGMNAALEYDGDDYAGRRISVKKAEAKGGGKGSGPGPKPPGCNSVVLKRLSPDVTEADIEELFRSTHPTRVGLLMDKTTGKSRCTARIDFKDGAGVDEAMKLCRSTLGGCELNMDYCKPRAMDYSKW